MQKLLLAFGLALSSTAFAAEKSDQAQVLITQGTASVTMADVDAYVARIPPADRAGFMSKPDRIQTMLRNILLERQLADESRKLGLDKDPLVKLQVNLAVDAALGRVRTQELLKSLKTPDFSAQAEEEYLANKSKYSIPARVSVKHILIGDKTRTTEEAAELAHQTSEKLAKDPAAFDSLVESLSDDASKKDNHGLIENATSEQLVKPFADAASKMTKVGEISPVIKTSFGYHILKAETVVPAKVRPYEDVRETILASLSKAWIEKQTRDYIDNLRNLPMQEDEALLMSLRDRYKMVPGSSSDAATAPEISTEPVKAD